VRLGPEHVGQRVVVRRRLGGPGGARPGPRFTDLLGELLAWDEPDGAGGGRCRVLTRHGEVSVALVDVVAGKPVPPAPERRGAPHRALGVEALEDVAADGWRPLELAWLGAAGHGWRLRAAEGFTGRANSVLPVGDPGMPLDDAVSAAEDWYRERDLAPRFAVPWTLDAPVVDGARETPLDAVLRARGYALDTPTLVMTGATREVAAAALVPGSAGLPGGLRLDVDDEPDDAWLAVYRYRGADLPPVARRLLLSAPAQVFVSVRSADDAAGGASTTVAVGRGASSRGWTGLTAMDVASAFRRRGLARAVVAAVAEWGLARGDRSAYLQVAEANDGARALYRACGFTDHHGYHYRIAAS
jgi:GNAT superfamily N-acetyltransferase